MNVHRRKNAKYFYPFAKPRNDDERHRSKNRTSPPPCLLDTAGRRFFRTLAERKSNRERKSNANLTALLVHEVRCALLVESCGVRNFIYKPIFTVYCPAFIGGDWSGVDLHLLNCIVFGNELLQLGLYRKTKFLVVARTWPKEFSTFSIIENLCASVTVLTRLMWRALPPCLNMMQIFNDRPVQQEKNSNSQGLFNVTWYNIFLRLQLAHPSILLFCKPIFI